MKIGAEGQTSTEQPEQWENGYSITHLATVDEQVLIRISSSDADVPSSRSERSDKSKAERRHLGGMLRIVGSAVIPFRPVGSRTYTYFVQEMMRSATWRTHFASSQGHSDTTRSQRTA